MDWVPLAALLALATLVRTFVLMRASLDRCSIARSFALGGERERTMTGHLTSCVCGEPCDEYVVKNWQGDLVRRVAGPCPTCRCPCCPFCEVRLDATGHCSNWNVTPEGCWAAGLIIPIPLVRPERTVEAQLVEAMTWPTGGALAASILPLILRSDGGAIEVPGELSDDEVRQLTNRWRASNGTVAYPPIPRGESEVVGTSRPPDPELFPPDVPMWQR